MTRPRHDTRLSPYGVGGAGLKALKGFERVVAPQTPEGEGLVWYRGVSFYDGTSWWHLPWKNTTILSGCCDMPHQRHATTPHQQPEGNLILYIFSLYTISHYMQIIQTNFLVIYIYIYIYIYI